jgi:hypothetical protein
MRRLKAALDKLDPRATEVLAYHAAIEREVELAIERRIPRPLRLKGLSYGHKVSVWAALQNVSDQWVERVARPMLRFNDLRNAIAHGNNKREVDAALKNLFDSIPNLEPPVDPDLEQAAAFIFGSLNSKVFWTDSKYLPPDLAR